ncbi:MAG: hypothetical protein QW702_02730 [Candidatus Bathyarchaeia archaeon]
MPPIVGLTLRNIVMVDLDGMPLEKVKELADLVLKRFKLGGYVILESSQGNYHVVFNRPFRYWSKVYKIMAWIAIMSGNPNVYKWVCMQLIKEAETLRLSPKPTKEGFRHIPMVVCRVGRQDLGIRVYFNAREKILSLIDKLGVYGNGSE